MGTQRGKGLKRFEPAYGGVAQLGEHLPCTQGVRSSSLLISTSPRDRTVAGRRQKTTDKG